ncbi:JmjC domain-containing protein F [Porphyridium purpureum]|uniref:JmjC domain-containing protein F n=1 Tax=Porphyridium purpureum TaxID=35688 RepID=A0A5J4YS66_PORPP|nr:JmjC domain-containing protein F [Porphyridium purpureum]|eukprot:POR0250..scf236_6
MGNGLDAARRRQYEERLRVVCSEALVGALDEELSASGYRGEADVLKKCAASLRPEAERQLLLGGETRAAAEGLWDALMLAQRRRSKTSAGLRESCIILLVYSALVDMHANAEDHVFRDLDRAMLLGAPPELSLDILEHQDAQMHPERLRIPAFPEAPPQLPAGTDGMVRVFRVRADEPVRRLSEGPFVFERCSTIQNWEATRTWNKLDVFRETHGRRWVPVELGTHGQDDWHESAMPLSEFVDTCLVPSLIRDTQDTGALSAHRPKSASDVGYIAQHDLFSQIPALLKDVSPPPPHCGCAPIQKVNAWLGTSGTVTPCHYDTYENFLVQIAGWKLVYLFPKNQRGMYPRKAKPNLSRVDVEAPDMVRFPLFGSCASPAAQLAILGPGEMLYIPAGWWHAVRSLTTSLSCNFWF